MTQFREAVLSMCWLLPGLGTTYFWVTALTTFIISRSDKSSASPSPAPAGCSEDSLKDKIGTWIRWMVVVMIASFFMFYLRRFVENLASEEKDDILEKSYKVARTELNDAIKAVARALRDRDDLAYRNAISRKDAALRKAERAKPKQGLARLTIGMQRWVRSLFMLALLCSFWAGVCASVAFYFSLSLQYGCANSAGEIIPFVVLGLISLGVHLDAGLVAYRED